MKKIFCIFLLVVFILPCVYMLTACGGSISFNNLTIKNWDAYSSIGAGFVRRTIPNNNVYAEDTNSQADAKLFGIRSDGTYEPIVFVNENGNETQQSLYLSGFSAFKNFTFISYSTLKVNYINLFDNNYSQEYVISGTGRLYRLDDVFEFINLYTLYNYDESDTAIFFIGAKITDVSRSNIYKMSIENNDLKIEKIIDLSTVENSFGYGFFVDKHGNIFSNNKNYIIKVDKTIHLLANNDIFKAMNNLVYCGNQVFNAEGELVDSDFIPTSTVNCHAIGKVPGASNTKYLIKQDSDLYYYYNFHDTPDIIYKVSFNMDSYLIDIIYLEDYESSRYVEGEHVFAYNKIYFINNQEIYYINITTGCKTILNTDYIFNAIWSDNKGNICFSAVDSSLDAVTGTIDGENNITIGIVSNGYDVIYIKPIN
ncbi:MAG: hypothetical protein PHR96_04575 [Clostridia bacterium]|nr:hypothetical protein [Clostridia bacterium]